MQVSPKKAGLLPGYEAHEGKSECTFVRYGTSNLCYMVCSIEFCGGAFWNVTRCRVPLADLDTATKLLMFKLDYRRSSQSVLRSTVVLCEIYIHSRNLRLDIFHKMTWVVPGWWTLALMKVLCALSAETQTLNIYSVLDGLNWICLLPASVKCTEERQTQV